MSVNFKNQMKLKTCITVFIALMAFLLIATDDQNKKIPAANQNVTVGKYEYNLTTVYDKCGHSVVTKGVKNNSTGDETVHINNYCPYHYRFYEKDGLIAIGKMDNLSAAPITVLEVQVSTLPYNDRIMLSKGIEVYGEEKLQMLIEDFES